MTVMQSTKADEQADPQVVSLAYNASDACDGRRHMQHQAFVKKLRSFCKASTLPGFSP